MRMSIVSYCWYSRDNNENEKIHQNQSIFMLPKKSASFPNLTIYKLQFAYFNSEAHFFQRRRQGEGKERFPLPRNRKNCCRKMMLFPKDLFIHFSNFSIEFSICFHIFITIVNYL